MKNELNEIAELLSHARRRANAIAESTQNPSQTQLDKLAEGLNEADQRLDNLLREMDEPKAEPQEKREHEGLTDEQLQEYYANALTTRQLAGGHGKAFYNGRRVDAYLDEMNARGIKPDGREGSFNGEGSY